MATTEHYENETRAIVRQQDSRAVQKWMQEAERLGTVMPCHSVTAQGKDMGRWM